MKEGVTSLDFAENYRFNLKNKVQSFHWSNDQITVKIATHYKSSDDSQFKSFICISECLLCDTFAVHLFQTVTTNLSHI